MCENELLAKFGVRLMLRDAAGHLLTPEQEGEHIAQYFSGIFCQNEVAPFNVPACQTLPFDPGGLFRSLRSLPLRKAFLRHCTPTCVLKLLATWLAPWLYSYLASLWTNTVPYVPCQWCSAWLPLVPKKGKSGHDITHWRPIGLQDGLGKSVLKTITLEARNAVLPLLTCYPQYAYLPGRGTHDAIAQVLGHCSLVQDLLSQA